MDNMDGRFWKRSWQYQCRICGKWYLRVGGHSLKHGHEPDCHCFDEAMGNAPLEAVDLTDALYDA